MFASDWTERKQLEIQLSVRAYLLNRGIYGKMQNAYGRDTCVFNVPSGSCILVAFLFVQRHCELINCENVFFKVVIQVIQFFQF